MTLPPPGPRKISTLSLFSPTDSPKILPSPSPPNLSLSVPSRLIPREEEGRKGGRLFPLALPISVPPLFFPPFLFPIPIPFPERRGRETKTRPYIYIYKRGRKFIYLFIYFFTPHLPIPLKKKMNANSCLDFLFFWGGGGGGRGVRVGRGGGKVIFIMCRYRISDS